MNEENGTETASLVQRRWPWSRKGMLSDHEDAEEGIFSLSLSLPIYICIFVCVYIDIDTHIYTLRVHIQIHTNWQLVCILIIH